MDDYDRLIHSLCLIIPSLREREHVAPETVIHQVAILVEAAQRTEDNSSALWAIRNVPSHTGADGRHYLAIDDIVAALKDEG